MNVGIVGIGGYGKTYLDTIAARPADRVVALCDLDCPAIDRLADAYGVPHRFDDVAALLKLPGLDAVLIATPHFLHHPMAMSALRAGKHVFCEKPLAISADHAGEIARTARRLGLTLACHYNQRTRHQTVALRQAVRQGLIGEPYQINARWMARWTEFMFDARTSWRLQQAKSGGGILIGRGSHLIDAVLYTLDFPRVESVRATLHRRLTGGEVDDLATAELRLAGGCVVHVQCSYVAHAAYADRMEYEYFGTQGGAAYLPGADGRAAIVVGRAETPDGAWRDLTPSLDAEAVRRQTGRSVLGDFLDAAAAGRDPLVTGEQAAYVTRLIEAAYESAGLGRAVAIAAVS